MRKSEPWKAIAMEAHSKQMGQPTRMHSSGELKYGQKV